MRECRFAFLGNANARPMWDGEMRTRGVCVVWANSHTLTLAGAHRRIRTGKPKWPPYTSRRPRVSLLRHVRRFLAVAVKERFDAAETVFFLSRRSSFFESHECFRFGSPKPDARACPWGRGGDDAVWVAAMSHV